MWGRLVACGRLSIGLLLVEANAHIGRLTIGRRLPACPTRLSGTMTSMRSLLLFALPALVFAQTARITAELGKTTVYGGLALSPDGKNLAWTQTLASQEQPRLWIGAVDGAFAPLPFAG